MDNCGIFSALCECFEHVFMKNSSNSISLILDALNVSGRSKMEFSMNSRDASTARRILESCMLHFATSAVTSLLGVSLKPCKQVGIPSASVVNCVPRNWPIPVLYATTIVPCVMDAMQASKHRKLANIRAKSVMDSLTVLHCVSVVKFITVITSIAPLATPSWIQQLVKLKVALVSLLMT